MGGEASGSRCGGLAEAGREGWLPAPRGPPFPRQQPPHTQQAPSHALFSHTPAHLLSLPRQLRHSRFPLPTRLRPHAPSHGASRASACRHEARGHTRHSSSHACTLHHTLAQGVLAPRLAGFCGPVLPRRCRPPSTHTTPPPLTFALPCTRGPRGARVQGSENRTQHLRKAGGRPGGGGPEGRGMGRGRSLALRTDRGGATRGARQGRGGGRDPEGMRAPFGVDADRVPLSSERDHCQEHSSAAPSPPPRPPSPARASVFASSRSAPVCRRAEEVV